jgi:2'-5' RNA ligase
MRLFIAIEMDPEPRQRLAEACEGLRKRLRGGRVTWTRAENLHITLRFLGDTAEAEAERVKEVLSEVRAAPCPFEPMRWGAFPSPSKARVIWAGSEDRQEEALTALAKEVESRLHSMGVPREPKPFRAHVTVGRVREPMNGLAEAFEAAPLKGIGLTTPKRFVLMESHLGPGGPKYVVQAAFSLER